MKGNHSIFVLLILFSIKIQGQYAVAGTHGTFYHDITPDTLLTAVYNGPTETLYLDINNDGINDIRIKCSSAGGLGGQGASIQVTTVSSSARLSMGYIDSTWLDPFCVTTGGYWYVEGIAKRYNIGDTIHFSNFWAVTDLNLAYNSVMCGSEASDYNWVSAGDKYIGVYINNGGTINFGWIKVAVTGLTSCIVKEYSFNFTNTGVVKNPIINQQDDFLVYPNPATDKIIIEQSGAIKKINELTLIDVCGVEHAVIMNEKNEIDVSGLAQSIYFLQIKTSEGCVTKKIVVQR